MACPNSYYHARDRLLEQTNFVINRPTSEAAHADGADAVVIPISVHVISECFLGSFEVKT
jgi:hypothetical protein